MIIISKLSKTEIGNQSTKTLVVSYPNQIIYFPQSLHGFTNWATLLMLLFSMGSLLLLESASQGVSM